jgi:hypothetical protein
MKPGSPLISFKFMCASLLLMLACNAAVAQSEQASASVKKSNSPAGNVCNPDKTFTFSSGSALFQFCLSDEGTIGELISPAGYQHISNFEGYVACGTGAMNAYSVGGPQLAESGWGPASTSQPGGPHTLPVTITRNSTDGKFQLAQTFEWSTAEKEVLITMTLKNISAASLTSVRLSRYFSAHVSIDSDDDIFDRDTDSTWGTDPGAGAGHHTVMLTALTFALTHTAFVEKNGDWNVKGNGAQTATKCTAIAQSVPTAPGNFVGRITYVLGTLSAGASKSVQLVYRRM